MLQPRETGPGAVPRAVRPQFLAFFFLPAGASSFFCCEIFSARTCFTHFCSSIRKARRTRFRTQRPHLTPPYARVTWRSRCFRRFLSYGRPAATPWSFPPHSPHLTYLAIFLTRCRTFRPPGVFTTSTLLLLVL